MFASINKAVFALRLIFWGVIIYTVDINIGTRSFKIDIIDDTVGVLFIVFGVFSLAKFPVNEKYIQIITYSKYSAIAMVVASVIKRFSIDSALTFVNNTIEFIVVFVVYLFCRAMIMFVVHYHLHRSEEIWRKAGLLWVYMYLLPCIIIYVFDVIARVFAQPFHIKLGGVFSVVFMIFFVPLVYLLFALWRTAREIEALSLVEKNMTDRELLGRLLGQD